MNRTLVYLFFTLFLIGCKSKDNPDPFPAGKFSGQVSFNANLSASEPLTNYPTEYNAIFSAGARGAQTAAPWSSLNPSGTMYDFSTISNPYFGLSALSGDGYQTIFLNIPIIAIDKRSMPSDISSAAFDDATVKARFHALIDAISGQLNAQVKYVSLGNEVDTYLSTHPAEWVPYQHLLEDAKAYLKSIKPGIQVGVTTTFDGATGTSKNNVQQLNSNMDIVILTYYPVDSKTFVPRAPSTVTTDVAAMTSISSGKPVLLQECGYPSSALLGSSEHMQAQFIYNALVELQKSGIPNFPFVSFFKYRDWDTSHIQTITGQTSGQPFFEFMSSLGLKKNNGDNKEAFTVVSSWISQ